MSLRAELIRLCLRWFVKRRQVTVAQSQQRIKLLERFVPGPPADVQFVNVDAGGIAAERITTPLSRPERHVLYLHGGAYVAGSPALYRDFTWRIAARARAHVLCIDYRLAPKHPFPAALDDALRAYRWMLAENIDPKRMAIVGDSAGGGLTFATMLRLRDEKLPLPAAAVVISPWTDLALTGSSLRRNAKRDVLLQLEPMPEFTRAYLAGIDARTPYASPLYGDPTGLPPTLIQVGGEEMLLDDSVHMADKMRAAGCEVQLEIWPRMPHVWHFYARIMPEAREALSHIGVFLRDKLSSGSA